MIDLEMCCICNCPTEKAGAGEDSTFVSFEDYDGPVCDECRHALEALFRGLDHDR